MYPDGKQKVSRAESGETAENGRGVVERERETNEEEKRKGMHMSSDDNPLNHRLLKKSILVPCQHKSIEACSYRIRRPHPKDIILMCRMYKTRGDGMMVYRCEDGYFKDGKTYGVRK